MLTWLKWFFSFGGIQFTSRKGKQIELFGKVVWTFNPAPGVLYRPNGPTTQDLAQQLRLKRIFNQYICRFCGTKVWSFKPVRICESLECFRKNGGWR